MAGSGRGTERFGHIIVDRISFTETGDGIVLPDGTAVTPDGVADLVEDYLLQLPGSGPGKYLTMAAGTGALTWAAIPTPTP